MQEFPSILHALTSHAETAPDKIAIIEAGNGHKCTYAELWTYVKAFSKRLKSVGVKPASGSADDCGTRVVVRCTQTIDYMVTILAINLSGGVAVPVEKNNADARIIEIMKDTDSEIYIASKPLSGYDTVFIPLSDAASETDKTADETLEYPALDALAFILFTTGTTGKSKGVMHSHRSFTAFFSNVYSAFKHGNDHVWLIPNSLSHINGLNRTFMTLFSGCMCVLLDGYAFAKPFFTAVSKYGVTILNFMSASLEMYLRTCQKNLFEIRNQIKYICLSSSSFSSTQTVLLRKIFPYSKVIQLYGGTEVTGCYVNHSHQRYPPFCVGYPMNRSVDVVFFDEEKNKLIEATVKEPGLFALNTPSKMLGYWKNRELTESVTRGDYIVFSDLGYRGGDGLLYFIGRADDIIASGGFKIAPLEIEAIANSFPGIQESACVGLADPIMGEVPKLYVVMKKDFSFDFTEIYKHLKEKLEATRLPRYIEEISELPKINDKINRKELKSL